LDTKGMIFDIQSFSVHDGPGCRTTVFMSGCPLSCRWCANPESWSKKSHIMFSELSCRYNKGCSLCKGVCSRGGLSFNDGKPFLNWDICNACTTFECAEFCCYSALKQCSKEYAVDNLMAILKRDSNNWGENGGVTFSGGEPLMQNKFLVEVLKECVKNGFHTAIETTAYTNEEIFFSVMKYIDFAFIDIKHMDREKHKEKTGMYNDIILRNVSFLANSEWNGRVILRVPVIGGFNDDFENMSTLLQFMQVNNLFEINILPFHKLGESKWNQLGKNYDYAASGTVSNTQMEKIQELFLENDIACYIAHDTVF
jgi:pyruvate formate lyase activating enzyme